MRLSDLEELLRADRLQLRVSCCGSVWFARLEKYSAFVEAAQGETLEGAVAALVERYQKERERIALVKRGA